MRAIAARFTDKSVKLNTEKRRVLTTLKMIYEGGSLDRKTANFSARDLSCVVADLHLVASELQANTMVPGLWAKAFAEARGQIDQARALYIRYRVAQLAQEASEQSRQRRQAASNF